MRKIRAAATARVRRVAPAEMDWADWISPSTPRNGDDATLHARIAQLAYSFWQQRGCPHGSPEEDWLRAEREIALTQ